MYKVINTSRRPVFVEGVCLQTGESTSVENVSDIIRSLGDKRVVSIEKYEDTKETKILTEEGTGTQQTRKRRSSKLLNE